MFGTEPTGDLGGHADVASGGLETIDERLFTIRGAKKRERWQFIKLVKRQGVKKLKTELTNADADEAFCTKCREFVDFSSGKNRAKEHMDSKHKGAMEAFLKQEQKSECQDLSADASQAPTPKQLIVVSKEVQEQIDKKVAQWVAGSMRPMTIVEDHGLLDLIQFLTEDLCNIKVTIPKRTAVREDIVSLAEELRNDLRTRIISECQYYSVTTDIWTDRSMRSFMALTVHYLDEKFKPNNWLLEVEHFTGRHDADAIRDALENALQRWQLDLSFCTRLLRDGASNAVAAANRLGVEHMSCIAHSLHLVVAGALIRKPKRKTVQSHQRSTTTPIDTTQDWESGEASFGDLEISQDLSREAIELANRLQDLAVEDVEAYVGRRRRDNTTSDDQNIAMEYVRAIVAKFRAIAVYFHRSSKGRGHLDAIQKKYKKEKEVLCVEVDCPTRWSSTQSMLLRFLQLEDYIGLFFDDFEGPRRAEYRGIAIVRPTPEDWLIAQNLILLLAPFAAATKFVGGEGYPTFAALYPCLISLERKLKNPAMFGVYLVEPPHVKTMNHVREMLLTLFQNRFATTWKNLLWVCLLDPRFAKMPVLSHEETETVHNQLLDAMIELLDRQDISTPEAQPAPSFVSPDPTPQKADVEMFADIFFAEGTAEDAAPAQAVTGDGGLRLRLEAELLLYIDHACRTAARKTDACAWWALYGEKYPHFRLLARKWLGCVATSVPSERAFSTAGNIVVAKRANLKPDFVNDLTFIAQNRALYTPPPRPTTT